MRQPWHRRTVSPNSSFMSLPKHDKPSDPEPAPAKPDESPAGDRSGQGSDSVRPYLEQGRRSAPEPARERER